MLEGHHEVVGIGQRAVDIIGAQHLATHFQAAVEQGLGIEQALKVGAAAGAATAMSDGADIGEKDDVDRLGTEAKVAKIELAAE